jgi:membrane-associated protease RseP (regulator of RpoE activity)
MEPSATEPYDWTPLPPARPRPGFWQEYGRNAALFVLTVVSVWMTGGPRLAAGLLSILLAHEMGHYLACRYYGVDATLPFFLPVPVFSFVGTLGAFIRIRGPIPHRRALFDIGVSGPLAGFLVSLPVLALGVAESRVVREGAVRGSVSLGEPILFRWASLAFHGRLPGDLTVMLGPLGLAAWFGLFVTALNLIPIGQLDGGHVIYSLFRERAHLISWIGSWVCVLLVYFGPNWIVWAILVRVLGRRHPRTLDDSLPLGTARTAIGVLALAVFVVCFTPNPIVWSWSEFFDVIGWWRR